MTAPTMTVHTGLQLFIEGPQPGVPDLEVVELCKLLRASVIAAVARTLESMGVEARIVCEPRPLGGFIVGEA